MTEIEKYHHQTFKSIRHEDVEGNEFWYARELGAILEYQSWRAFERVIVKAIEACKNSGQQPENHFVQMDNMVQIGSGARREVEDYMLSRYACYLIVQNGDPSKPVIANGQTYFAIQTRKQELQEQTDFAALSENDRRLAIRREVTEHNKALVAAAQKAGVETNLDYAIFQDHGYKGLYGGLGAKDLHARKNLKKSQKILDHMGSTELAANLFRATQTEEKLTRENISGKEAANRTHHEVGAKVRRTIAELGGTMPENLPAPEKSIKQLEREQEKKKLVRNQPEGE